MLLEQIIPILQLSIGPVILLSGAGLIMVSMTNRYARVIDYARFLADSLRQYPDRKNQRIESQLEIMVKRAGNLRRAIALVATSLLLAAILVITLFILALFSLHIGGLVIGIFILCMGALSAGLIIFILDINASMSALKIEIHGE